MGYNTTSWSGSSGVFNQGMPVSDAAGGPYSPSGGTHTTGSLYVGGSPDGTWGIGTYNLHAGTLSADNEYIGYSGIGTFNQTGGTNDATGSLTISPYGTYNMSAGALGAGIVNNGLFTYSGGQVNGSFAQGPGGTLTILTPDGLDLTGSASLGGSLNVSFPSASVSNGSVFDIIRSTGPLTGMFSTMQAPFDPATPYYFTTNYGPHDLTLTSVGTRAGSLNPASLSGPVLIDGQGFDVAGTIGLLSAIFNQTPYPADVQTSLLTTFWNTGTGSGYFGSQASPPTITVSSAAFQSLQLVDTASWGMWQAQASGAFSNPMQDKWAVELNMSDTVNWNRVSVLEMAGSKWSANTITGSTTGYGADVTGAPVTWVSIGDVLGTYNPGSLSWQATDAGVTIETNKFLQMANDAAGRAILQQLNVPPVEVGMATLSGRAGDTTRWTGNALKCNDGEREILRPHGRRGPPVVGKRLGKRLLRGKPDGPRERCHVGGRPQRLFRAQAMGPGYERPVAGAGRERHRHPSDHLEPRHEPRLQEPHRVPGRRGRFDKVVAGRQIAGDLQGDSGRGGRKQVGRRHFSVRWTTWSEGHSVITLRTFSGTAASS